MCRWIKLYEKLKEWEWYKDLHTKSLFIHLLLTANTKDGEWRGKELKAGARTANLPTLSEETGMDIKQTRRALNNLIMSGDITVVRSYPTERNWVVVINHWSKYQPQKKYFDLPKQVGQTEVDLPKQVGQTEVDLPKQVGQTEVDLPKQVGQTEVDLPKQVGQTEIPLPLNNKEEFKEFIENARVCVNDTLKSQNQIPPSWGNFVPWPKNWQDVKAEAERQCILMTDDEAETFFNYYSGMGWIKRGDPIRNWKMFIKTWHSEYSRRQTSNGNGHFNNFNNKTVAHDGQFGKSDEF